MPTVIPAIRSPDSHPKSNLTESGCTARRPYVDHSLYRPIHPRIGNILVT